MIPSQALRSLNSSQGGTYNIYITIVHTYFS